MDQSLGQTIVNRIVAMLINEAADAVHLNIASPKDVDLAMTKGVNYPKGLLAWCNEWGAAQCLAQLDSLYHHYHEDRYRACGLLRTMAATNNQFIL
jgi:3-hydroxybutyryl-CoA dehydrogenase